MNCNRVHTVGDYARPAPPQPQPSGAGRRVDWVVSYHLSAVSITDLDVAEKNKTHQLWVGIRSYMILLKTRSDFSVREYQFGQHRYIVTKVIIQWL